MSEQASERNKQFEEDRGKAVGFGMAVYTGGIVAATAMFIFFILTAFPESAYFIRFLMVVAALCVGASAIAFRYALENWAVSGSHRKAAIVFYYGEIFLVGLNTVVSFAALLYRYGGNSLPPWVAWYEPFTIITIAYVILAWGTLFVLDPRSKAKARQIEVLLDFDNRVVDGMSNYLNSQDGLLAIQENANQRIRQSFAVRDRGPRPWIDRGDGSEPITPGIPPAPASRPALPVSNVPALPRRRNHATQWTLDGLLNWANISRADAQEMIRQYQLFDARSAYAALDQAGYIPETLTVDDFMPLYCELLGVAPTWGSVYRPPTPTAHLPAAGPNGVPTYHPVSMDPSERSTRRDNGSNFP